MRRSVAWVAGSVDKKNGLLPEDPADIPFRFAKPFLLRSPRECKVWLYAIDNALDIVREPRFDFVYGAVDLFLVVIGGRGVHIAFASTYRVEAVDSRPYDSNASRWRARLLSAVEFTKRRLKH